VLALALTIFLLAQAGVPLTTGFVAKFGVIAAAVDAESYVLAVIAMLASVIAAFLYLRIIVSMYLADPQGDEEEQPEVRVPVQRRAGPGADAQLHGGRRLPALVAGRLRPRRRAPTWSPASGP
jgi:NADH-quinone oxidoreductase subunit N